MSEHNNENSFLGTVGRFKVRLVRKGQKYGTNKSLVWGEEDPGVEFYVTETKAGKPIEGEPWFTSRYYYTTLSAPRPLSQGLCLEGSEPIWLSMTGEQVREAMSMVDEEVKKFATEQDIQSWRDRWKIGRRNSSGEM